MKGKASEGELNALHAMVAKVLRTQLEATAVIVNELGEEVEMSMVTPQMVGQAIKFLNDNKVTATMEIGDDMDSLAQLLKDKPKKGRAQLMAVPATEAAAE